MPLNSPCRWDKNKTKSGGDLRAFADPRAGGEVALEAAIRSRPAKATCALSQRCEAEDAAYLVGKPLPTWLVR
jgi:hypothetical protein